MPKPGIDLTGHTIDRWTVKQPAERSHGQTRWLCECACGAVRPVYTKNLRAGLSRSCGCMRDALSRQRLQIRRSGVA